MISFNYHWVSTPYMRPRVLAMHQRKAKRTIFEPVRPAVFKPGPYKDSHGNLRFLGRK